MMRNVCPLSLVIGEERRGTGRKRRAERRGEDRGEDGSGKERGEESGEEGRG